jgi:ABC-type amino acid transport substrate-binding protein
MTRPEDLIYGVDERRDQADVQRMNCRRLAMPSWPMTWRASAVAAVLIFAVSGGANAEAPKRVPTLVPGVLSVGTYFVNPPFEYVSDGRKVGFEVDLIREVARRLHLKTSFVNTRWEVMLQQMQEGRYDCIVGGITITPTRQVTLAWSDPYMTTTLSLVIDSAETPQIRGLADLKDAEVGVQAATTDYDVAVAMQRRGEIGKVKVYPFDRIADAMTDLDAGRITAVMKVYPVAQWLARRTPGLRIVAQIPNDPQPLGIGFNKNNPELLAAVNGALSEMKQDRTYARLARKWDVP